MKLGLLIVSAAVALTLPPSQAQTRQSRWHTVRGVVLDSAGSPIVKATVYLRDLKAHRMRMVQSDNNGRFSFGAVNLDISREIYADVQGTASNKVRLDGSEQHEIVLELRVPDVVRIRIRN